MRQGALVCPVTVGRETEMHRLTLELDEARLGRGRLSLIDGEAGVGKSRLVIDLERVARGLGMTALHGRAVESEASVPYRVIASALLPAFRAGGPPDDPMLGPYRSALSLLVPEWAGPTGGSRPAEANPTLAVLEATGRLLSVLARGAGLLIVLEDLQWADAETLAVANYLTDTLASERVLCVATVRSGEPGAVRDLVARAAASPHASLLVVEPLPPPAIGELLMATLGAEDLPDGLASTIVAQSEGIPLVAEEVLADLKASGRLTREDDGWRFQPGGDRAAPEAFRRLVERRVARLEPATQDLLKSAAVLGRDFDWSLLSTICGLDDGAVLRAMGEAVEAQLLVTASGIDRVAFRHALIRDSVAASLLPPQRASLARAAAIAVEAGPDAASAERLELASSLWQLAGDDASAARLLVALGRDSLARSALTSAQATLERAVATSARESEVHADALELLADTLSRAGQGERWLEIAQQLMTALAAVEADASRLHRGWLRLARAAIGAQSAYPPRVQYDDARWVTARLALSEADRLCDGAADRAATAALRALMAIEMNDYPAAKRLAIEALGLAERCEADAAGCEAAYVLARVLRAGSANAAIEPLQRALVLAERARLDHWRLRVLLELGIVERDISGRTGYLVRARDLARESGALLTAAVACMNLGIPGAEPTWTYQDTMDNLEEAIALSRRHRLPTLGMSLRFRAQVLAMHGERAEFEASIQETRELAGAVAGPFIDEVALRLWWDLFNEDRPGLMSHLDDSAVLVDIPAASSAPVRGLFALMSAVLDRNAESACHRVANAGYGSALNEGLVGMGRAVILGRRGDSAAAERARSDAAAKLRIREMHALAHRFVAEAAIQDGWGDPAGWLRNALECFDEKGMVSLARACAALLRRLGEPVARRGRGDAEVPAELRSRGVTSREMDVLLLVREGLSNTEIADRLFMSRRTVETHVSRLLEKTGTSNRGRLAAATAVLTSLGPHRR